MNGDGHVECVIFDVDDNDANSAPRSLRYNPAAGQRGTDIQQSGALFATQMEAH
jgi:hypothetical protein